MTTSAPRSARERVRAELTEEIKQVARRHLAEHGSGALSLRAVARELGMVSSAVYRYFPSRDDLLTALIVDAYDAVGDAVESAESAVERRRLMRRWLVAAQALRSWALAGPQEYALIFGSPVPGYAAPVDTVDPAARVPLVLLAIVRDGVGRGTVVDDDDTPMPRAVRADLRALGTEVGVEIPERVLARAVMAWSELIGAVSFELFGHLHNVIHDYDAWFAYQVTRTGRELGLAD